MANYSRISREDTPDGQRLIARMGRVAWLAPLVVMVLLLAFAGVVFNSIRVRPDADPIGPQIFGGLLLLGACGAFLAAIQAYRGRLALLVQHGQAVIERTGLRTKRITWCPAANTGYFVAVLTTVHVGPKGLTTTASSLEVVDETFHRQRLVDNVPAKEVVEAMATTLADSFGLTPPVFLEVRSGQTEEILLREAHLRLQQSLVDNALNDMRDAVAHMEQARDHLQSELQVSVRDEEKLAALQEMEAGIERAKSEVLLAEFDISQQNCSRYTFANCRPGESVRYARLEMSGESTLPKFIALPGTTSRMILVCLLTPIMIPLTGILLVSVLSWFPLSVPRMQAHFAITDLFGFGVGVLLWCPVVATLWQLWTWLKLDAACTPFRVDFHWPRRELVIERRNGVKQVIEFAAIHGLSAAVVHQSPTAVTGEWKHDAALFVEHGATRTAILELDHKTNLRDDHDVILDRFEPLAMSLAHFLDVPLERVGRRTEKFDAVGFPFAYRGLHPLRILRLASSRVRRLALLGFAAAAGLLLVLLCVRFVANRHEAEKYVAAQQAQDLKAAAKAVD